MTSQSQNTRSGPSDNAIGITTRLCATALPWSGVLRRRFTDFLVNEIQKDGSVLHLTNYKPVQVTHHKQVTIVAPPPTPAPAETPTPALVAPKIPSISPTDITSLTTLLGPKMTTSLHALYESSFTPGTPFGKKGPSVTIPPNDDKALRSRIHGEIRRIFNSALDTTTDPAGTGAIIATIMPRRGNSKRGPNGGGSGVDNRDRGGRTTRERPEAGQEIVCPGTGAYLHFTLYKQNRDTMEAAGQIAKQLNMKPAGISYAGTKDRRAVTVQRCSVRRRKAGELARLNSQLYDIVVADFEYRDAPIRLGELAGNEFTITLKGCSFEGSDSLPISEAVQKLDGAVKVALKHMQEHGWLNYFGHQRFGTFSIGTHTVGQLILSGNMKAACHALLSYDEALAKKLDGNSLPNERSLRDEAMRSWCCRAFLRDNDAAKALDKLPRRYSAEGTIIRHLSQRPTDYMGALLRITRGLRTMYLHAYQSFVWNHAASKRWELYGAKVVTGDLVRDDEKKLTDDPTTDQDGEEVIRADDDCDDDSFISAHLVTDQDIAAAKYTIFDVVLPTPGYSTLLPHNAVGDFYREFMMFNGGIDAGKMARPQREFSLAGRYRLVMARFLGSVAEGRAEVAGDLKQLEKTDLDVIKERVANEEAEAEEKKKNEANNEKTIGDKMEGSDREESKKRARSVSDVEGPEAKKARIDSEGTEEKTEAVVPVAEDSEGIAVVVKFQLAKSAYATVALRELMGAPATQ